MNLNGILIGSEDPKRLVAYYTSVLGEPMMSMQDYTTWRIGEGTLTVGPHDEVKGPSTHPGRIIWNIESDDVPADFDRMRAAGVIVIAEPYGFEGIEGMSIATLADPDDNYFQLMSPIEM